MFALMAAVAKETNVIAKIIRDFREGQGRC